MTVVIQTPRMDSSPADDIIISSSRASHLRHRSNLEMQAALGLAATSQPQSKPTTSEYLPTPNHPDADHQLLRYYKSKQDLRGQGEGSSGSTGQSYQQAISTVSNLDAAIAQSPLTTTTSVKPREIINVGPKDHSLRAVSSTPSLASFTSSFMSMSLDPEESSKQRSQFSFSDTKVLAERNEIRAKMSGSPIIPPETQQQQQQQQQQKRNNVIVSPAPGDVGKKTPAGPSAAVTGPGSRMFFGGHANTNERYIEDDDQSSEEEEGLRGGGGAGGDDRDGFDEDDSESSSSSVVSWISWYCSLPGHEFFVEVPEFFIEDDFNLTGLNTLVLLYNEALDMILDLEPDPPPTSAQMTLIESSAEMLYGLIHQRFLLTKQGLHLMAERLQNSEFGTCPREGCGGAPVLPCGRSDQPSVDTVKMFCVRCCDLYHPREAKFQNIDGAFFGTTFPHLLYLSYPHLIPPLKSNDSQPPGQRIITDGEDEETRPYEDEPLPDYQVYIPRIFGFRISERSRTGPRMSWLRWKEGMPVPGSRDHITQSGGGFGGLAGDEDGDVDGLEEEDD
ncbi:casein kinase 2 regulatory subunit [Blyttiomyces sp. JEL0837]|nr:casein kinase 2 regulatory subunit [Blyttiomyces sp. JEL0837]